MIYSFLCPLCKKVYERDIPMDKYDLEKNHQVCSKCGKPLKRKFEFSGSIGRTGGYDSVGGKASWQS